MLAGCSSAVLSQRNRLNTDDSLELQQKMSTQRFDLSYGLSRKEGPRVSLSSEKPGDARSSCSFQQNTVVPSSRSLVAQTASWDGRREIEGGEIWPKGSSLKRLSSFEDIPELNRAKRSRGGPGNRLAGGGDDEHWFPPRTEGPYVKEEVCYTPRTSIFIPGNSSSDASWFGSETVATSEATKIKPDPSSSSDTHTSSSKHNGDSSENETVGGSSIPNPIHGLEAAETEHLDLELMSLLTACAESFSYRNHTAINYFLARLGELASPTGTQTQRVVAYFTEGLALRAAKLWPRIFYISPLRELADRIDEHDDSATAFRFLNQVSPIPKFIHFSLNERLLRAFEGKDRVHIVDFDIKQGLQWPSLFQSLASRPNPPSHVRITGIGESKQDLQDTGALLSAFAEALKLPFQFHPVVDRLEDVRLWMLHVKERECVAVNCVLQLHRGLYDESGGVLMDLLGLIRSANPQIVLMAEEESEQNDLIWEMRFASAFKYYSCVFDSLDSTGLTKDLSARIKIEEMFARKIRNIVSCEGGERVERHQGFGKWRRVMEEDGGFKNVGIGERERLQSNMLLRMYPDSQNFSIEKQGEEGDGLTLKWLDQPLYTVSAWAPIDIAGSSSAYQPG